MDLGLWAPSRQKEEEREGQRDFHNAGDVPRWSLDTDGVWSDQLDSRRKQRGEHVLNGDRGEVDYTVSAGDLMTDTHNAPSADDRHHEKRTEEDAKEPACRVQSWAKLRMMDWALSGLQLVFGGGEIRCFDYWSAQEFGASRKYQSAPPRTSCSALLLQSPRGVLPASLNFLFPSTPHWGSSHGIT
ncbi:hypothetical protein EYF80_007983 [Liparis tanakae]|uniref:Uncharacterized protein n=1 Tax=Liparis tanakae TaxID=230148 RepID=A0A4Z2IWC3_9TELE|nr:hypothetical protein EYF80_007983 [Liparis tanakae]